MKGKAYQSRSKNKEAGRGFIKNRISIDVRPHVVDDRSIMGDWQRSQWRTGHDCRAQNQL
jgi:IS30 family transposase